MLDFNEEFWIIISTVLFIFLAYSAIRKAIVVALDKKILEIRKTIEESEQIKEKAQKMLVEFESKIQGMEEKKKELEKDGMETINHMIELKKIEQEKYLSKFRESSLSAINHDIQKQTQRLKESFVTSVLDASRAYLENESDVSEETLIEHLLASSKLQKTNQEKSDKVKIIKI